MTFDEWVDRYEAKTKEEMILPDDYDMYFVPSKGFMSYKIIDGTFIMGDTSTDDMEFMSDFVYEQIRKHNCHAIATNCLRNPKAYLKRTHRCGSNAVLDLNLSGYRPDKRWYWTFREEITC